MKKISIEVYWDPLCSADWDSEGGMGRYKARLENHYNRFATGKSRLEAVQNLLKKCAHLEWEYMVM